MKLKPFRSFFAVFWGYALIVTCIILCALIIHQLNNISDSTIGIAIGFFSVLLCVELFTYFIARIIYPIKYKITSDQIIMYIKRKQYHIINISDIAEIGVRRVPIWSILALPLAVMAISPEVLNVISLRYYSDVPAPIRPYQFWIMETLTDDEKKSGLVEMVDCFTMKQISKICKLIGKSPIKVDYLPKKLPPRFK